MFATRSGLLQLASAALLVGSAVAPGVVTADEAQEKSAADPYQVPDGDVDQLMQFLRTGKQQMNPKTVPDAQRMFWALDEAAEQVFRSPDATIEQRLEVARYRTFDYLRSLQVLNADGASDKLTKFLEEASNDPATEIQDFAKLTKFGQRLERWPRMQPEDRTQLIAEVQEGVNRDDAKGADVAVLLMLADTVAQTPDSTPVVKVIREALPRLAKSDNEGVALRLARLEGVVRRLDLPGNKLEVEGTLLDGREIDWESYRGKVVLVDYWATQCPPCIEELPNVLEAYRVYHDKGFEVLGICLDSDQTSVERFLETRKIPWETMFHHELGDDATWWDHPMASKYAINAIPRAILVDQQGNVVHMSAMGDELDKALAKLLGPAEASSGAAPDTDSTVQAEP